MSRLGTIFYWAGRGAAYFYQSFYRGWHCINRTDWKEPLEW